jgi:hypothetical protein
MIRILAFELLNTILLLIFLMIKSFLKKLGSPDNFCALLGVRFVEKGSKTLF